jgi:hypothetical protein
MSPSLYLYLLPRPRRRPSGLWYTVIRRLAMKTRDQEIIELTQTLKALGYNVEAMKFEHCGGIDDPQHVEVELKIIRFRDAAQD